MKDFHGNDLSPELRALVKKSVSLLGEVIRHELGAAAYARIEKTRHDMAALRGLSAEGRYAALNRGFESLRKLPEADRLPLARSFTLMLELMNACENAYRTFRLHGYPRFKPGHRVRGIVYVLTAHPTEARSPGNIAVFHDIQNLLVEMFATDFESRRERLRHLLELAWQLKTSRRRKPSVEDEAEHIYSILLRDETLRTLLAAYRDLSPIYVRTWVGGDKDGNPFVNERTLRRSLQLSRVRLVRFAQSRIFEVRRTLNDVLGERAAPLARDLRRFERALLRLRALRAGDGARVMKFRAAGQIFNKHYLKFVGAEHPAMTELRDLVKIFPALAVPLELRESSDLIVSAARGDPQPIRRMLGKLAALARGGEPVWYARGLIISMADSADHIRAAAAIARAALGDLKLPIIPLFEQRGALEASSRITAEVLRDAKIRRAISRHWGNQFEVMLGYSDSAKEAGVLESRLAIKEAVLKLDALLRRHGVTPVFFHGSGGSIDRGGGSVEEQTAWWPGSALDLYKATIQGEMVERSFASPEIARRQFERILRRAGESTAAHGLRAKSSFEPALREFADRVSQAYQKKIFSPAFSPLIENATPYMYLDALKLGSRPTKRAKNSSFKSLRAIPWVMCWTQTRVLFPTWWGIGQAWDATGAADRRALRRAFRDDPLFGSYVKALGFTLAKIELPVWRIYLERGALGADVARSTLREFELESAAAARFVRAMSGSRDLLWFRKWLGTSVALRSPMIHPLNLLQVISIQEKNAELMRETVTGISSGMMTTG